MAGFFNYIGKLIYNFFFEVNMYKGMTLNFTDPICKCKKDNITLWICAEGFTLKCDFCDISVKIPTKSLNWSAKYDIPHPGNDQSTISKDNVIPIKKE
jgi:hypothetical protein